MFACAFKPGWIPTEDVRKADVAYSYWTGEKVLAYVARHKYQDFHAWVFTGKIKETRNLCYQYPLYEVEAYELFSCWADARDWAQTMCVISKYSK